MAATLGGSRRASIESGMPAYSNANQDQRNDFSTQQHQQIRDDASRGYAESNSTSLRQDGNEAKDNRDGDGKERKEGRDFTTSGSIRLSGAVRSNQNQVQDPSSVGSDSTGAKRLTRPPQPARDTLQISARGEKTEKGEVTSTVEQEIVYSIDSLKIMSDDQHWGNRLKSFEIISGVLNRTHASKNRNENGDDLGSNDTKECFNTSTANIECIVDVAVNHLGDAHQKVAVEAMTVMGTCVQMYTTETFAKLGVLLTALFNRLADRRAQIK